MAQRPPPPPPRRRSSTLEKLRRTQARDARPFDPEDPPERYAKRHHFAVNPTHEDALGLRVRFHRKTTQEVLEQEQQYNSWSSDPTKGDWFIPERLGGSDYSGGYVHKANFKVFTNEWADHDPPFYTEVYGGHGTYGVAIHIDSAPDEVWEQLQSLENYPVLDEEVLSELEEEGKNETWERWACAEYKSLWEERYFENESLPEAWVDMISDDAWREHFEACAEAGNIYWEAQGDQPEMHIDVKRVFEACKTDPPWPPVPAASAEAVWQGATEAAEAERAAAGEGAEGATPDDRRRRYIDQLRADLDRPYRRFQTNAATALIATNLAEWLKRDPYAGLAVNPKRSTTGLYSIGVIESNVLHTLDPHEAAALVMRGPEPDAQSLLVLWYGSGKRVRGGSYYTVFFIDPTKLTSLPIFTIGRLGEVDESISETVSAGVWDDVVRGLRGALTGSVNRWDLAALMLYLYWYSEAELDPPLMDYASETNLDPILVRLDIPSEEFESAWAEVFETHAKRERDVDEIMHLVGMGRPERAAAPPPAPPAPSGAAEARRRRHIEYALEQLKRPVTPRFQPNTLRDANVNDFLESDPYSGLRLRFKADANSYWYVPGTVLHNVTHDGDPHADAILLMRSEENGEDFIVFWVVNHLGPHGEALHYALYVLDPKRVPKPMLAIGTVAEVQSELQNVVSEDNWDIVLRSLVRTGGSDAVAMYLRWYIDSGVEPSLTSLAVGSTYPGLIMIDEVPAAELTHAFSEVFELFDRHVAGGESLHAPRPAQPGPPAPSEQPFWLEGPQERPPRRQYSEGELEAFRARGLRQGYDYNPRLSEGMTPEQFDPVELARGTFVEMEHTDDVDEARSIAMDHLVEDPLYYQKLQLAGL